MADCVCMRPPFHHTDFDRKEIGVDKTNGRFGVVSVETCKRCRRRWLRYFVEFEGFPESGRWYRGHIPRTLARSVLPETAVQILEGLEWHFYGGSYFKTTGSRGSGAILVDL